MPSMRPSGSRLRAALYRGIWRPLDLMVTRIEYILLFLCSCAIIMAMLLTTIDVILRYGFRSPMTWAFDFVMLYLMPAAYYLAFAYGMKTGTHLAVDFFTEHLPRFVLRWICPVILLLAAALMFYISWRLYLETYENLVEGHTMFGSIAWLTWPTGAIIGISFFTLAIRLVLVALQPAVQEN